MAKGKKSRIEELRADCAKVGLYFATYSPGDGTRFRFFLDPENDYFSADGIYTTIGIRNAEKFAAGFVQGQHAVWARCGREDITGALSDCVHWETNERGDCGGRLMLFGASIICETCYNRARLACGG